MQMYRLSETASCLMIKPVSSHLNLRRNSMEITVRKVESEVCLFYGNKQTNKPRWLI